MREVERVVLLRNVDQEWMDHIDAMEQLQDGIRLRAYAQQDPVVEYRLEGFDMFDAMIATIRENTARMVLTVRLRQKEAPQREQVAKETSAGTAGDKTVKRQPVRKAEKAGPQRPLPLRQRPEDTKSAAAGTSDRRQGGGNQGETGKRWAGGGCVRPCWPLALAGCEHPHAGVCRLRRVRLYPGPAGQQLQGLPRGVHVPGQRRRLEDAQENNDHHRGEHAAVEFCNTYNLAWPTTPRWTGWRRSWGGR